jgi:hypothetical protein
VRILVSGPREGFDQRRIELTLDRYLQIARREDFVLIEGCARGVDTQAWLWAKSRGLANQVLHRPAPWSHLDKAAGRWRNRIMLRDKPDRVVVFHPDIEKGHGTKDMFEAANAAGLPVHLVSTP